MIVLRSLSKRKYMMECSLESFLGVSGHSTPPLPPPKTLPPRAKEGVQPEVCSLLPR